MNNEIEIIRSSRKTLSVEITRDLKIIIRVPFTAKNTDIERFIAEKSQWINKHLADAKARADSIGSTVPLTDIQIRELTGKALAVIPAKTAYYAGLIDVTYGKITVRKQKTRWGSCSSKGNLNFNCLLMLCPESVLDYVIIHELCHRKEMNHSKQFYKLLEQYCPNRKNSEKWLKENGASLICR